MRKLLSNKAIIKISFLLIFLFYSFPLRANVIICTWNLENFGKSKSETEIKFIANVVSSCDIVAIQEVVAGNGGEGAVERLANELNAKYGSWDYIVSKPTTGSSYEEEKYAFLWKTKKISKIGEGWLEKKFQAEIDREPFFVTFKSEGKEFTLVDFHAIPKARQPEIEIKYLKFLPAEYPSLSLIFMGDFNCSQSNTVFNPLKSIGYNPALTGQKTSLRQKCINGDCLASKYDNIFYPVMHIKYESAGVIHFYQVFKTIKSAHQISDHIPVVFEFTEK